MLPIAYCPYCSHKESKWATKNTKILNTHPKICARKQTSRLVAASGASSSKALYGVVYSLDVADVYDITGRKANDLERKITTLQNKVQSKKISHHDYLQFSTF